MIPLSTYRKAVKATRTDYDASRAYNRDRTTERKRTMARVANLRLDAMRELFMSCGIDERRDVWSETRAQLQSRILKSVERSAGVDWSKLYEEEQSDV